MFSEGSGFSVGGSELCIEGVMGLGAGRCFLLFPTTIFDALRRSELDACCPRLGRTLVKMGPFQKSVDN